MLSTSSVAACSSTSSQSLRLVGRCSSQAGASRQVSQVRAGKKSEGSYTTSRLSRRIDILKELGREEPAAAAQSSTSQGQQTFTATPEDLKTGNWISLLPDVNAFFKAAGREVKAFTMAAGRSVVLYRHQGVVYCSDVNSTAFQFPMVDARLLEYEGVPAVEVPLDGTVYELASGKVLKWCPTDGNLIRSVLGALKKSTPPKPLPVYPTHITPDGKLRIRLA